MSFFKRIWKRFKKNIKVSCKFLLTILLICFVLVCISSFDLGLELEGNMITVRTIFSTIMGYIIENVSSKQYKKQDEINKIVKEQEGIIQAPATKEKNEIVEDNEALEVRVIIVGSVAIIFTVILGLGALLDIRQDNQSLILIKNTVFASIGFLISVSRGTSKKN